MGIAVLGLELMLLENRYREISGSFLRIGKHTVHVPQSVCQHLFKKYGIGAEGIAKLDYYYENEIFDTSTRHGGGHLHDHDLISCISSATYETLDISDYEGAKILHDMNEPIPDILYEKYDFIYDGSTMDNVFDPVMS